MVTISNSTGYQFSVGVIDSGELSKFGVHRSFYFEWNILQKPA